MFLFFIEQLGGDFMSKVTERFLGRGQGKQREFVEDAFGVKIPAPRLADRHIRVPNAQTGWVQTPSWKPDIRVIMRRIEQAQSKR